MSSEKAHSMTAWLEQIGNARSLDTIQDQFREMQGLAAEIGGDVADAVDTAFDKFLRAADAINPLYAKRASLPPDKDTLGERGQILERTIAAVDALAKVAPPRGDEPDVSDEVRASAVAFGVWAPSED